MREALDRFFGFSELGTNPKREIAAGLTTFLTMAYIIFVNPAILSGQMTGKETGMDFGALTMATCLSAAIATAIMGLLARYPVALAPGMGENFFFVTTVLPIAAATGHPEPWRAALGAVFVSGVLFFLISLSGIRRYLLEALSSSLKNGIAVGIGLFIAFIGLQGAQIILKNPGSGVSLNPHLFAPDPLLFLITFTVIAVFQARRVRGAILWGIAIGAVLACCARLVVDHFPALAQSSWLKGSMLLTRFEWAHGITAAPPSLAPTLFKMDIGAAFTTQLIPIVLVFLFMDMFDTMGTLVGVAEQAGLMRGQELPRAEKAFLADATGTVLGAAMGTSTVTSYIESLAGVEQGGRTGLTALTTAVLFLVALFFSPIIKMIASYPAITAPAVVMVGAMMMRNVTKIEWTDPTEAIPAFVSVAGIPMTYSISDGLALSLLSYPVIKLLAGRGREVPKTMYVLAVLLILYFALVRSRLG